MEKLISFSRRIKDLNVRFYCSDYIDMFYHVHDGHTFIYLDPPYMLTNGSYNDGKRGFKGRDASQELALFDFLDKLNGEGSRFMLSYVLEHKGKINQNLLNRTQDNNYHIIELGDILGISGSRRKEILLITFSELTIDGRNSGIQSVPTAFNIFYMCPYEKKKLYYYFICKSGNPATDYPMFVYRLMQTVGFTLSFITIEDMMRARDENRGTNKSNHSTYISKNDEGEYEAYCKTYGACNYESSLICYAMSMIIGHTEKIKLYEILEGNLKELPELSLQILRKMDTVDIIKTDLTFEKRIFEESRGNQLRSPRYQYNLLDKLGEKHCALCGCTIPDIIHGAHIWPVASIRATNSISVDDKVRYATDGDNGLWLCENHHKLFDRNMIAIMSDGSVKYNRNLSAPYIPYLQAFTENAQLPPIYLNDNFSHYVELRNRSLNIANYVAL